VEKKFDDFPEIVPTSEITTKTERRVVYFSSAAVGLCLEWVQRRSIDSTHLGPASSFWASKELYETSHGRGQRKHSRRLQRVTDNARTS